MRCGYPYRVGTGSDCKYSENWSTVPAIIQWTSFFVCRKSSMITFWTKTLHNAYNKTPPNVQLHILVFMIGKISPESLVKFDS